MPGDSQADGGVGGGPVLGDAASGIVVGSGQEQAGFGFASRQKDEADAMVAELAEQAAVEHDVAAEDDALQGGHGDGADPFAAVVHDQGFGVGVEPDVLAVDVERGHGVTG